MGEFWYDLHLHSCLSPCGSDDMTPNNLVHMAALLGYDIIALTDHNTARNTPAAVQVGMELTTAEEAHVVCLFPTPEQALAFEERIREDWLRFPNDASIFGNQWILDSGDEKIGEEPDLPYQIMNFTRMHRHCDAGCGELFPFDDTVKKNPRYLLDILKGAFASGARYLSFYSGNSDLVRVTGYLVKKSDLEKFEREEMTLNEATVNGSVVNKNLHLLDRKVRGEQ